MTTAVEPNSDPTYFEREGYVVVPGLLSRDEAAEAYGLFEQISAVGLRNERGSGNERALVRMPLLLDAITRASLQNALAVVFGDDLQLLAYDSLETAAHGGPVRDWHADFSFRAPVTLCANVGIYLQDMTDEVGPLYVIPGSHRWPGNPSKEQQHEPLEGEQKASLSAGDAIIFDAQLWHTGSRNETDRPRRAVFAYFGRHWMKRMDAYYETPLPESVTSSEAAPLVQQLFGLRAPSSPSPHGADYNADNPRWR